MHAQHIRFCEPAHDRTRNKSELLVPQTRGKQDSHGVVSSLRMMHHPKTYVPVYICTPVHTWQFVHVCANIFRLFMRMNCTVHITGMLKREWNFSRKNCA